MMLSALLRAPAPVSALLATLLFVPAHGGQVSQAPDRSPAPRAQVVSVELVPGATNSFNLTVGSTRTFVVGRLGLLAHNTSPCRTLASYTDEFWETYEGQLTLGRDEPHEGFDHFLAPLENDRIWIMPGVEGYGAEIIQGCRMSCGDSLQLFEDLLEVMPRAVDTPHIHKYPALLREMGQLNGNIHPDEVLRRLNQRDGSLLMPEREDFLRRHP